MKRFVRLLIFTAVLTACTTITSPPAYAITPTYVYYGWVEKGGCQVQTVNFLSTTKVQCSYPGATVSVYTDSAGTILDTIYSDETGTAKANPFQANSDGSFLFYSNVLTEYVKAAGGGLTSPFQRTFYGTTAPTVTYITQASADVRYLKLDASNSPVTGSLTINGGLAVPSGASSFGGLLTTNGIVDGSGGGGIIARTGIGGVVVNPTSGLNASFWATTPTQNWRMGMEGGNNYLLYNGTLATTPLTVDATTGLTTLSSLTVTPGTTTVATLNAGAVSGTTGAFSGAVSGTTGTFSSNVSGVNATLSGGLTVNGQVAGIGSDVAFAGDSISRIDSTTAGGASVLRLRAGNGGTSSRNSYVETVGNEGGGQTWRSGMQGSTSWALKDVTSGTTVLSVAPTTGNVNVTSGSLQVLKTTGNVAETLSAYSLAGQATLDISAGNLAGSSSIAYMRYIANTGLANIWNLGMDDGTGSFRLLNSISGAILTTTTAGNTTITGNGNFTGTLGVNDSSATYPFSMKKNGTAVGGVFNAITSITDSTAAKGVYLGYDGTAGVVAATGAGTQDLEFWIPVGGAPLKVLTLSSNAGTAAITTPGKITSYAGNTTAGQGIPIEVGSVSITAQAASIGATNIKVLGTDLYRVCWAQTITRAATSTSSLITTFGWTNETSTAKTSTYWTDASAGTTGTTADASNTLGSQHGNCFVLTGDTVTNLTYATTYATSGATTMQYSLKIVAERLQ